MKKRRWMSLLLTCVMVVSALLAGCGGSGAGKSETQQSAQQQESAQGDKQTEGSTAPAGTSAGTETEGDSAAAGLEPMTTEEITLTYACWGLTDKGEREAKDKQIQAFMDAYPNIHVEFIEIDQATWDDSMMSLASTGSLPDVFWVFSLTNAIANDWALDVTDYFAKDPDAAEVYPGFVEPTRVNGKLFGMPVVMFPCLVFLNKTLFETYNEPLPSYDWTVDEFKEIAERLSHPDEFYFGASNPIYADYFPTLYDGTSMYGWDGEAYHFGQSWIDAYNLRLDWIDNGVCEWMAAEDKQSVLGDPGAWPPGYGRTALHLDWPWTIAQFEDTFSVNTGMEWLYYPQPVGPSGEQMAIVDYGIISAATEHPREAWELQKWTSWGEQGIVNRYEGYKEAGLNIVSRMPVSSNVNAWNAVRDFTDREDMLAVYDHMTNLVAKCNSFAPGYAQFEAWCVENGIWGQLDSREVSPADIAAELEAKANEFCLEWLSAYGNR